jgi:hypothetical protein
MLDVSFQRHARYVLMLWSALDVPSIAQAQYVVGASARELSARPE